MGCGCSTAAGAASLSSSGGALTFLIIGLDNSGKTTLAHTINGGAWREGRGRGTI
jgi:GTPase SAR1 family protein